VPDDQAYLEKLRALSEGRDPLSVQESTACAIAALVSALPESRLHARPKPGKWSIVEIVAHMADERIGHQLALPPDTRIAWMPARRI